MPYFSINENGIAECLLCPHECSIARDKTGICGVRKNNGYEIELATYGVISGYSLDPVEKKPLYHFYPGTNILSLGSYGCNMRCDFCQNYSISQRRSSGYDLLTEPVKVINDAETSFNNIGIAFTYNEPVIWFEFVRDVSVKAITNGLMTVMVSNGFIKSDPLREMLSFINAFNIDLKAFNDDFYHRYTGAAIGPVKETLRIIAASDRHLEITTLIIPGLNDSIEDMREESAWIAGELGKDTPLHLSRYFPRYKRDNPATPAATLNLLHEEAAKRLSYVYTGNSAEKEGQDTFCPSCGTKAIKRSGYNISIANIDSDGNCRSCKTKILKHYRYMTASGKN